MTKIDINTKLLEIIPEIKELFNSVTSWQDGIDTGSTVVIEDVFMVYLKESIKNNNYDCIKKCTSFIEWLSEYINDEYAGNVLVISIFEYIYFASDREQLEGVLGPKAKKEYFSIDWN